MRIKLSSIAGGATDGLAIVSANSSASGLLRAAHACGPAHCPYRWGMLMKVAEILAAKGRSVSTVQPNESIETLTHRLRLERIGALIVTSNGHDVEGIISERDIVYGLAEHGRDALDMPASALMNLSVPTCRPEDAIASVMAKLTAERVRHLAVLESDQLVGIISIGDVIKRRLDEVELEANVLRDYAITR